MFADLALKGREDVGRGKTKEEREFHSLAVREKKVVALINALTASTHFIRSLPLLVPSIVLTNLSSVMHSP